MRRSSCWRVPEGSSEAGTRTSHIGKVRSAVVQELFSRACYVASLAVKFVIGYIVWSLCCSSLNLPTSSGDVGARLYALFVRSLNLTFTHTQRKSARAKVPARLLPYQSSAVQLRPPLRIGMQSACRSLRGRYDSGWELFVSSFFTTASLRRDIWRSRGVRVLLCHL